MQLRFSTVCADARQTPDGKIDVHGVFHDLSAPGFPAEQDHLVLVLVIEPMDAADTLAVDPAAIEVEHLGADAWARQHGPDRLELGDLAAGLFDRLAAGHLLGSLARLHDARDRLD